MPMEKLLERLLAGDVIILDGGTGTEIKRRGLAQGLSRLAVEGMINAPDRLQEIHEDYIQAGADVIITNTYIGNGPALTRAGVDSERVRELNILAADTAKRAREAASGGREVVIAGSMGPVGRSYDPDDVPPYETCLSTYQEQARALAEGGVDVVLVEAVSRVSGAKAGVEASREVGLSAWAAFVADSQGRVQSGESMKEAAEVLMSAGATAILINCTPAPDVALALQELIRVWQLPIGAYAQAATYAGRGWEFAASMSPEQYLVYAQEWVSIGAQIVGGCCGTTPEHIRALKASLPEKGPAKGRRKMPSGPPTIHRR
ncbi:MAG: homocysteine S-methyltransferase family protein [Dehalococcoidia bacterium]